MSATLGASEEKAHDEAPTTVYTNTHSGSSSEYGNIDQIKQERQHDQEVLGLVRKFTSQTEQHHLGSPFTADESSHLNPKSDRFRARDWAKAFYNLRYSSQEAIPRIAGIAFRDLNVWGEGSPTDFQSTVGNYILKLPSLFGRGAQKIEILRGLDGLILPGEQLCVLGPPGYFIRFLISYQIINIWQIWLLHTAKDDCWRDPWLYSQPRIIPKLPRYSS